MANEQIINIGCDPITDPDTDPYRDTGKSCLGGGMHCHSVPVLLVLYVGLQKTDNADLFLVESTARIEHCYLRQGGYVYRISSNRSPRPL